MRLRTRSLAAATLGLCCLSPRAFGQAATTPDPADSSSPKAYSLFRPTPADMLRNLSTDRPNQTESPYTVDAGRFQVELDLARAQIDRFDTDSGKAQTTKWVFVPFNVKAGLASNVDFQVVFDTYINVESDIPGAASESVSGTGDLFTRLKVNLWGNDGGRTALAVLPFAKWPVADSDLGTQHVDFGVLFPLAVGLCDRWGAGLMTGFSFVRDPSREDRHTDFINTVTVSRSLAVRLGAYAEFFSAVPSTGASAWQGQLNFGATWSWSPNVQLDLGCNFGVTEAVPEYGPFAGLSFRL